MEGPTVAHGDSVFQMESRESTVRFELGPVGVVWSYLRPTRITAASTGDDPIVIRDYAMIVRVAVWALVLLTTLRRSTND